MKKRRHSRNMRSISQELHNQLYACLNDAEETLWQPLIHMEMGFGVGYVISE